MHSSQSVKQIENVAAYLPIGMYPMSRSTCSLCVMLLSSFNYYVWNCFHIFLHVCSLLWCLPCGWFLNTCFICRTYSLLGICKWFNSFRIIKIIFSTYIWKLFAKFSFWRSFDLNLNLALLMPFGYKKISMKSAIFIFYDGV